VSFLKKDNIRMQILHKTQGFFTDKIVPMKIFSQTCNIMHSIVTDEKNLNNLIVYEQEKF